MSSIEQENSLTARQEIACFSYDDAHQFHMDDRSLRYYYPPTIGADLSRGFDTFHQLDDTADDHLDSLLRTIVDLEMKTGSKCEADIVTWRGMMTKVKDFNSSLNFQNWSQSDTTYFYK